MREPQNFLIRPLPTAWVTPGALEPGVVFLTSTRLTSKNQSPNPESQSP